jgi:hypothetical protein
VLSDVSYQLYYPDIESIPDLSVGSPVVISGIYEGGTPKRVTISGTIHDGSELAFDIEVNVTSIDRLKAMIARQKLQYLLGQYWMEVEPQPFTATKQGTAKAPKRKRKRMLKNDIIHASLDAMLPCLFTSTIAFEDKSGKK